MVGTCVRIVQWMVVMSYLIQQHEKLMEELGSWMWFGALIVAMTLWAYVEAVDVVVMFTFPEKLILQAKEEREEREKREKEAHKAEEAYKAVEAWRSEVGSEEAEKSDTLVPRSSDGLGDQTDQDAENRSVSSGGQTESSEDVDLLYPTSDRTSGSSMNTSSTDSTDQTVSKGHRRMLDIAKERKARERQVKAVSFTSSATTVSAMGTKVEPAGAALWSKPSAAKMRRRRQATTAPMRMAPDSDQSDAESS